MDQNLKQNFDLNSATIGVGLAEASKLLKMASAIPTPLVVEFQSKFFFKFWSMVMQNFEKSSHLKHCE